MNNEQPSTCDNDEGVVKMPIRKVFTILGLGLSLSIILVNVVAIILAGLISKFMPDVLKSDFFMFGMSTVPLILIGMPVLFAITSFIPTTKTSYKSKISFKNMVKIFLISYISVMLLNIVSTVLNLAISKITGSSASNPLEFIQSISIWPTLLFGVILSPIVEEIMFRHIIINKLRGYGSGVAIFTSAFAFGLYHGNLFQMLYAFALGLVFATIVYKTGKLRYAIILHIAVNFIGMILPLGLASQKPILIALCVIPLFGIAITGFILGIITLCKTDFSKIKHDIMPRQYVKPFFLNIGMILYIIIILALVVISFLK